MHNNSCTVSDPAEGKRKLELVMFIVNSVKKKKKLQARTNICKSVCSPQ